MATEVGLLKHFLSEKGSEGDIVKNDTPGTNIYEGIYVGTGGTVVLINKFGNTQTWVNVPNAFTIPVKTSAIKVASTAANMIGL